MYPILFEWGSFVIPSWHFMYAAGAVAAFFLANHLNQKLACSLEQRQLSNLYICCYLLGYFGARLLSIIVEQPELHSVTGIFNGLLSLGPMTFYGGALGSGIAGFIYCRWAKLNFRNVIDISLPSGLLALAIGRIGCFLNGDDFGSVVYLPAGAAKPWWAVVFPNLPDQHPRYPVQLWETVLVLAVVITTAINFQTLRKKTAPGMIGFFCVSAYANIRFGLEFYRGDFRGQPFDNWMSTSQLISIILLFFCVLALPYLLKKKTKN